MLSLRLPGHLAWTTSLGTYHLGDSTPCFGKIFPRIRVALFAHGMSSIGVALPERWRPALARARRHGAFLGTTPSAFPEDFAMFARFNRDLRALPERHPAPNPLPLAAVETIIFSLDAGRQVVRAG